MATLEEISRERAKQVHASVEKGEAWYKKIASEVEKKYHGQYIVIDVETGEYLVDENDLRALELGGKKFAGHWRHFKRVGYPGPVYRSPAGRS